MVHNPEQPPLGPESFTVARNGNILVADTLNQRIQVFAPDGTTLRSVPTPGVLPGDVMTDGQDRLFVYDQISRALLQYDSSGALQATLQLQPADMDTRGYFHLVGDAVYFADAAVRDVLVAIVKDGLLAPPGTTTARLTDGIHAESGHTYSIGIAKAESLRLQVRQAGSATAREVQFAMPDILSACFAGEDQSGCFYVQAEQLVAGKVTLEVLAFSPAAELLSTTLLPENDYTIWTAKLMHVSAGGDIVQFLPGRNEAWLNIFSEQPQ